MILTDFSRSLFGILVGASGVSVATPMSWASASQTAHKAFWRKRINNGEEVKVIGCGESGQFQKEWYELYVRLKEVEGFDPKIEVSVWGFDPAEGVLGNKGRSMWYKYDNWRIGKPKGGQFELGGSEGGTNEREFQSLILSGGTGKCESSFEWPYEDKYLTINRGKNTMVGDEKKWISSEWMICRGWFLNKTCEITLQDGSGLSWGVAGIPSITYWAF